MEQVEPSKELILDGEIETSTSEAKNNVISTETTPNELKESGELEEESQTNDTPESSIVNFNSIAGPGD